VHKKWLADTVKHVENNPKRLHPVIQEFKDMIENDTRLRLLFDSMFDQIPSKKPYNNDPAGNRQIRDHEHMLQLLNHIMTTAPSWDDHSHEVGLVGLPIQALFDWPMGTPSGYAIFLDPQVNAMLKKVLNAWATYLQSSESANVLDTSSSGWFGRTGCQDLMKVANTAAGTSHKFEDLFHCEPSAPHHGFTSWDNFFTRTFRDGIRPVAYPNRADIIVNACESLPYKIAHNVQALDKFWIKSQPYSVMDMLAHDKRADQFVGGTIYQAFLSALSYHRWHSPVSGTIVDAYVKDGTYYSEPLFSGMADPHGPDPNGEGTGQGYISAVATRGIIFIEADNPAIGLMCVVPVGMVEVSTCDITVKKGQHVEKGDQLGMVSSIIYPETCTMLIFV
jgi:phosphatidylserine decarboxylase